jgi:hypothetical protein
MNGQALSPSKEPRAWVAYRIRGAKATWLGHVEAADRDAAIATAAVEFGVPAVSIIVQQVGNDA